MFVPPSLAVLLGIVIVIAVASLQTVLRSRVDAYIISLGQAGLSLLGFALLTESQPRPSWGDWGIGALANMFLGLTLAVAWLINLATAYTNNKKTTQ